MINLNQFLSTLGYSNACIYGRRYPITLQISFSKSKCHARTKKELRKLSFLKFCQEKNWNVVLTYLLDNTDREKYIKWIQ